MKRATFTGGIDLAGVKEATLDSPISPCPRPSRLLVPLALTDVPPATPNVGIGERVSAGQKIAGIGDPQSAIRNPKSIDVLAPLDGKVSAFVTAAVAARDGFVDVPAVELTDLSEPVLPAPPEAECNWRDLSADEIRARIASGGLITFRRAPGTMADWLDRAIAKGCRTLIANGMEHQPYVTADHRLLTQHGGEVVGGLAIIAKAIGAKDTILAVDHRRIGAYRGLLAPARSHGVNRVALWHKYPMGSDVMLTAILTGKETPPGGSTMDVGTAVIHPSACRAVWQQVVHGRSPLGRVVTVSGERIAKPANYFVPFGTPCCELAGDAEGPLIHGGPMNGLACPDGAVVGPATDAVLAIDSPQPVAPGPCIRCGWCTDQCPVRLNVAALNDMYELSLVEQARRAGVMACLECGVCGFLCPAQLPLTHRVKALKRAVREAQKNA
ncbi:MAG: 4Fe-4S dicluster domain-containing protein [Phycisphaerae bacterium]